MASSRAVANSTLVLRILVLIFSVTSLVVMVTNNNKRFDIRWKDVKTYRYVTATAIIAFIYTLIQIPFTIYYVCTKKGLIRKDCLPEYDFYADKVITFLLATGVGAGFAVTYELKGLLNSFFAFLQAVQGTEGIDEARSAADKFLNRSYIATGILFGGFLCMVVLSVLSSVSRNTASSSRGFFG